MLGKHFRHNKVILQVLYGSLRETFKLITGDQLDHLDYNTGIPSVCMCVCLFSNSFKTLGELTSFLVEMFSSYPDLM